MTDHSTPKPDPAAVPKGSSIRRIGRLIARHKIVSSASIGVIAVGLAVGGVLGATAIQHQTAASEYRSSSYAARDAYTANTLAHSKFVAAKSAATDYVGAAEPIVSGGSGYLDAAATATFAKTVTQLGADLRSKPGTSSLHQLDALGPDATTEQYSQAVPRLHDLASTAKKDTATTSTATSKIQASQQTVEAALVNLARSVDGASKAALAANTKADAAVQQAFTAAAKAVGDAAAASSPSETSKPKPTSASTPKASTSSAPAAAVSTKTKPTLLVLVTTYLAKGKALSEAQAAALAAEKAAADAAAQQAAQESGQSSYVDSDGNSHSTPRSNGGGGSSGGGSSGNGGGGSSSVGGGSSPGGGSTSGGGGSSGGGGGPVMQSGYPVYTQEPLPINSVGEGSNCGGGAIPIPSNAKVTSQGNDSSGEWCIYYTGPNG